MKKITNQYWAGLFDGEGCVYIQRHKKPSYPYLHVVVSITQKDPRILYLAQKIFGGSVYMKQKPNVCYHWKVGSADLVLKFLQSIVSHVFIKKRDVEIGIEFVKNATPHQKGYFPLSINERERKDKLYQDLITHRQRLNAN